MNIRAFKASLREHPNLNVRVVLPDGEPIAPDFHITEVGHVVKNFIDCGGTRRKAEAVVLQAWVAANDPEHRLSAGQLSAILDLAGSVIPSDELPVEVEYEGGSISQYPVSDVGAVADELRFTLTEKHTDCLAREACGLEPCGCDTADTKGKCCS
ncbi:MAG TPA: DUF6428 family protein [Candidatus Didemnitutus sp.]|jgi:hypothetical protein